RCEDGAIARKFVRVVKCDGVHAVTAPELASTFGEHLELGYTLKMSGCFGIAWRLDQIRLRRLRLNDQLFIQLEAIGTRHILREFRRTHERAAHDLETPEQRFSRAAPRLRRLPRYELRHCCSPFPQVTMGTDAR